ncbi:mycofactocin-coupled SDR family oxidoreductase [Streptomyces sp. NPDC056690]|uniref:mycofactocin-coupled SDR family oxidoreductase n=1 Tax=unclassified Streptomyces TaxID=2593676 RepID=UPI0036319974
MTGRVEGKVAFITGAARGQGRAHAIRLASEGADIVGLDICAQIDSVDYAMSTPDDLKKTVELVEKTGRRMVAKVGDVRNAESLKSAYQEGLDTFGHIDLVVANAGIMPVWGNGSDTMQAWQDCLDVLLTGVLNTVEVAYPRLLQQGTGGSIVITGSMAATQPMMRTLGGRTLGLLGYSAAKAALVNLAQNYASILAYHNIRVNAVHPTGVNTPMVDNDMVRDRFANVDPEDGLTLVNAIPVDTVEAEDIANTVLFLCSDESRYLTGSALRVDAGSSLR